MRFVQSGSSVERAGSHRPASLANHRRIPADGSRATTGVNSIQSTSPLVALRWLGSATPGAAARPLRKGDVQWQESFSATTRYILGGEWVEVFEGKRKRHILRGGKRVAKSTPGAVAVTTLSREWYGYIAGRREKLSTVKDTAEKMLRKLLTEREDLKYDRFAAHRQAPLTGHIEKFGEYLKAKGPRC